MRFPGGRNPQRPVGSSQAPKLQAGDGPHKQQENTTHLDLWKGLAPPNQAPGDRAWAGPLLGSPALSLASTQRGAGRISGWEHLRKEKGMDITLRPSSLALEGYPHDLSTPGRDSTRRSSKRSQVPWLPLGSPAWAFPAPAGILGCSRPGVPFSAGGRPGVQRLCYRFPALLAPCPHPCYCPLFPGRCPLHSFCLCSVEKALLFPSASDSKVACHGTVPEPVFI